MKPLRIPAALMSRWQSIHVDREWNRRHINYDTTLRRDAPIYRYMQASDLLLFLRTGEFRFSSVESWPDPYEQWWHHILFDGDSPLNGARAFASCWTWQAKDEPFWRLYESRCDHRDTAGHRLPQGPPPVRIKCTVNRMIDALTASLPKFDAKVYIAPVAYTTTKELLRYRESLTTNPAEVAREAAHALTYKRSAFRYEKEVRTVWVDRAEKNSARVVPMTHSSLIDEIMIGPVPEPEKTRAEVLKEQLKDAGYEGRIKRSLIYQPPSVV